MAIDVEEIRKSFPVLKKSYDGVLLSYLDTTATAQTPSSVIEAMDDYYFHHYSSVKRGAYQLSEETNVKFEATRTKIQKFINAQSENEIVFTRGTTESLNLIASSWGRKNLKPGDEIILSALEHHANIVPWQMIAEEKGAIIKVIPCNDDGELLLDEYKKLLSDKTKVIAITYISNAIGTINPVQTIIDMAKDYECITVIDAAQASAHLKLDVQKLNCDFLAFSGHKTYGPTGIGVLFGKYDLLCSMPPYQGGGEMIDKVTFEKTTFAKPPAKFEAGTPAIAEVIGLGAAIDFINKIGLKEIAAHEDLLLKYATQKLLEINGLKIIGNAANKASLISFVLDGIHPHDAGMIFDEEAIALRTGHHCAQPVMDRFGVVATIRASFGVYSTIEEIDKLVKAIHRVQKLFG